MAYWLEQDCAKFDTIFSEKRIFEEDVEYYINLLYQAYCTNKKYNSVQTLLTLCKNDIVSNGRTADCVAVVSCRKSSHARASLQRRQVFFWWKQSRRSECRKPKGEKTQRGQKSKSGLLFLLPLLWGLHKARCDFLNTADEKRLDFHRPADLLRAGVSQIQFQTCFRSISQLTILLQSPQLVVLIRIKIEAHQEFTWIFFFVLCQRISLSLNEEIVMRRSTKN